MSKGIEVLLLKEKGRGFALCYELIAPARTFP